MPNTPIERHWFQACLAEQTLDPAAQRILDAIQRLDGTFCCRCPTPPDPTSRHRRLAGFCEENRDVTG